MKIPRPPHNWQVSPKKAIAVQKKLAALVRRGKPSGPLRFIAGLDAAFSRDAKHCIAAVVLWDLREKATVEQRVAVKELRVPYIPGLLTFREGPALIAALRKLEREPDALMFDGQGIAHPRGLGIAAHIGVLADKPSVGCAKSRLTGEYNVPGDKRGSSSLLTKNKITIGSVVRTKDNTNPVFVSIGHKIDLETSVKLVLECSGKYRLPEPTRLADQLAGAAKRKEYA